MLARVNSVATVGLDAQFLEEELGGDSFGPFDRLRASRLRIKGGWIDPWPGGRGVVRAGGVERRS